jgi:hypothetical protein
MEHYTPGTEKKFSAVSQWMSSHTNGQDEVRMEIRNRTYHEAAGWIIPAKVKRAQQLLRKIWAVRRGASLCGRIDWGLVFR